MIKNEAGLRSRNPYTSIFVASCLIMVKVKSNRSLYSPINRPTGFQKVEVHRFEHIRHIKVVRLSLSHTGYLYPQEKSVVLISVSG